MDNQLYERLRPYFPVLELWASSQTYAGGDMGGMESINLAMGNNPTNFNCSTCKAELLNRLYHAKNNYEKSNSI